MRYKKVGMSSEKQQILDRIEAEIKRNNVCPDLAKQATQLVFGVGNPNAKIVFIGEAPGKNEDLRGQPFVGAAGKFLDEMLLGINLSRQDVYITNIVKYRPPNNRDPFPEEKEAFLPYLLSQIEAIDPEIVVLLGRHSMNCFLPDFRISNVHGRAFRKKISGDTSRVFVPLYHPAAALYNGSMRQILKEDFAKLPKILNLANEKK